MKLSPAYNHKSLHDFLYTSCSGPSSHAPSKSDGPVDKAFAKIDVVFSCHCLSQNS